MISTCALSSQSAHQSLNLVTFYRWPQLLAQLTFTTMLKSHLPESAMLYNRILMPHNTFDRHCLFAASYAPPSTESDLPAVTPSSTSQPDLDHAPPVSPPTETLNKNEYAQYTIVFADRSRRRESQVWLFNPLASSPIPLSPEKETVLKSHMHSALLFLKNTKIPAAPGHPFIPVLRFACVGPLLSKALIEAAGTAFQYCTVWDQWFLPLSIALDDSDEDGKLEVPSGFHFGTIPENQLDTILTTSKMNRQPATMLRLPNTALLDKDGRAVSWVYIGIDGALATLYTLPEHRGKGFGLLVTKECVRRLGRGEFRTVAGGWEEESVKIYAWDGSCGWTYSDVERGNTGSESVMRRVGAVVKWESRYVRVDSSLVY